MAFPLLAGAPAAGQVVLTQDAALRLAFPAPATIERGTAFLDAEQLAAVRQRAGAGVEVAQAVVTYYVGREGEAPLGVAYFDAHVVRTLAEVVMVVVGPADQVVRVELLRFAEPPEYAPPAGWLGLFARGGAVPNLTGATLTATAVERAVRRVLAYHAVLRPLHREGT